MIVYDSVTGYRFDRVTYIDQLVCIGQGEFSTTQRCSCNDILFQVHEGIYYWNLNGTHSYEAVMTLPGDKASYTQETQGESVCWEPQGNGYYTLSEGHHQPIYHYSKI